MANTPRETDERDSIIPKKFSGKPSLRMYRLKITP
jgi:hypothetical protein